MASTTEIKESSMERTDEKQHTHVDETYGWAKVSSGIAQNYILKCRSFSGDDFKFQKFRQDADYKKILEGGDHSVGQMHLERIKRDHGLDDLIHHLSEFKENDTYGGPTVLNYEIVGDINPCTLLYVCNALDIKKMLGTFRPKKIVEIGGGFGGLCKTLSVLYDFEEYVLVDLPDVLALCKKYLDLFPNISKRIKYISCNDVDALSKLDNISLCIAISSLAECDLQTQKMYSDNILMNSIFGFVLYNTVHTKSGESEFSVLYAEWKEKFHTDIEVPWGQIKYVRLKSKKIYNEGFRKHPLRDFVNMSSSVMTRSVNTLKRLVRFSK
jgi:hypothetical protein